MSDTPMIIAEISANHSGSLFAAQDLIRAASWAGADIVKFQCWTPGAMVRDAGYVMDSGPWQGMNLQALYEKAHTPWHWFESMTALCKDLRIGWSSSVCDIKALEFLESLGCERYKIASFEITDLDLIAAAAETGKPLILSTGMATDMEVKNAYAVALTAGLAPEQLTVLHCVSSYPTAPGQANLQRMSWLQSRFRFNVGYSDHTTGLAAAVVATSMGATVIEKHLTLPTSVTLDEKFSMTATQFQRMVVACREAAMVVDQTIGVDDEQEPMRALRRSLHYARDMKAGEVLAYEDMVTARPATGMAPAHRRWLEGAKLKDDHAAGTPVLEDQVSRL